MTKNKKTNSGENYFPRNRNKTPMTFMEKITDVKTGYARLAILLLAVNCALTGYSVYRLSETQDSVVNAAEQPIRTHRMNLPKDNQADLSFPILRPPATQTAP